MDVRVWRKEGWGLKNWCFQTGVLENTLDCPLDYKEIQPVNPKGNQSWIFTGRTDAEAEAPIFWTPHENWHLKKGPDAGKDWRQEEKGMTEGEMVEWHHWLNGHEFEQAPGVGDGQGNLACCSPWGCKELDTTATELNWLNVLDNLNKVGTINIAICQLRSLKFIELVSGDILPGFTT